MRELSVSRPVKMFLALTVAFLGPGLRAAYADTVNASGTFTNGESFIGTLVTTAGTPGTITAGSLTVSGGPDAGTYNNFFAGAFPGVYLFQESGGATPSTLPYIDLLFSDTSPISEASLCTDASLCGSSASQLRTADGFFDLTAAVATPEPGSLLLLTSGLLGLGLLLRKQRLATN
jgi:hypothetical protein